MEYFGTGGCFGVVPRAADGACSRLRISEKLLVVVVVGPLVVGAIGVNVGVMGIFRICAKLCVVGACILSATPGANLCFNDICVGQVSAATGSPAEFPCDGTQRRWA